MIPIAKWAIMVLAGLLLAVRPARADFTLYGDDLLTVNTSYSQGTLFDQSRAVIVSGGRVTTLQAYGTSAVNMSGGSVFNLQAFDSSTVGISGGEVSGIYAYDTSTVKMSGGEVSETLDAHGTSTVNMSGGTVDNKLHAYESSTVGVSGGEVSELYASGTSTVNISGGTVDWTITASNSSRVNISSESLAMPGGVDARDTSTVGISGGRMNTLTARNSSMVNMSGGSVGLTVLAYDTSTIGISGGWMNVLTARNSSTVNISGGHVTTLNAYDTSTVTFYGKDFILGTGLSLHGDRVLGMGYLSGEWFDGTRWTTDIYQNNDDGVNILAVPEPATLALLALGGLAMLRRRGRAR